MSFAQKKTSLIRYLPAPWPRASWGAPKEEGRGKKMEKKEKITLRPSLPVIPGSHAFHALPQTSVSWVRLLKLSFHRFVQKQNTTAVAGPCRGQNESEAAHWPKRGDQSGGEAIKKPGCVEWRSGCFEATCGDCGLEIQALPRRNCRKNDGQ